MACAEAHGEPSQDPERDAHQDLERVHVGQWAIERLPVGADLGNEPRVEPGDEPHQAAFVAVRSERCSMADW